METYFINIQINTIIRMNINKNVMNGIVYNDGLLMDHEMDE